MAWLFRKRHPHPPPPKPDKPQVPDKLQTHVLGVNLQCCEACPRKIEKKLLKIKGVNAVNMDVNKGLVSVTGVVAPSVLLNVVKKVNKTGAMLISSKEEEDKKKKEEEEKKKKEEEEKKKKEEEAKKKKEEEKKKMEEKDKCSYKSGGEKPSSDKESGEKQQPPKDGMKCQGDFANLGSNCNGGPVQQQQWMPYPPPLHYQYPPMPPYYGGGPPPMPGYFPPPPTMENQPQPIKVNPPPTPYPDDFYKRKVNLQAENNMFQQFRDEKVDSCSIM